MLLLSLSFGRVAGTRGELLRDGSPAEWKANAVDAYDVTESLTDGWRVMGGKRARPAAAAGRTQTGNGRHVCAATSARYARVKSRFPGRALTITVARRESGVPLAESFVMRRTFGHFVSERVPHAFRWCSREIRVEVTVVGRHCECATAAIGVVVGAAMTRTAPTTTTATHHWRTARSHWRRPIATRERRAGQSPCIGPRTVQPHARFSLPAHIWKHSRVSSDDNLLLLCKTKTIFGNVLRRKKKQFV